MIAAQIKIFFKSIYFKLLAILSLFILSGLTQENFSYLSYFLAFLITLVTLFLSSRTSVFIWNENSIYFSLKSKIASVTYLISVVVIVALLSISSVGREEINFLQIFTLALYEELIFRVLIPLFVVQFLKNNFSIILGIVVSAVIFSMSHFPATAQGAVYYFFSGILFSAIFIAFGFWWSVGFHSLFNIIALYLSIDYKSWKILTIYFILVMPLILHITKKSFKSQRKNIKTVDRDNSIDSIRSVALLMVLIDNLTLFSWGHDFKTLFSFINLFENIGYFIFLACLGCSVYVSSNSKGSTGTRQRYFSLLKIGILNMLFFFPFDILVQISLIAIILSKVSFWRSFPGLVISIISLISLALISSLFTQGTKTVENFPINVILNPYEFYQISFANLLVQIFTIPLYIGLPGMAIYLIHNSHKAGNIGLTLLSLFATISIKIVLINHTGSNILHLLTIIFSLYFSLSLVLNANKLKNLGSSITLGSIGKSTLSGYLISSILVSYGMIIYPDGLSFYFVFASCLIVWCLSPILSRQDFSFENIIRT